MVRIPIKERILFYRWLHEIIHYHHPPTRRDDGQDRQQASRLRPAHPRRDQRLQPCQAVHLCCRKTIRPRLDCPRQHVWENVKNHRTPRRIVASPSTSKSLAKEILSITPSKSSMGKYRSNNCPCSIEEIKIFFSSIFYPKISFYDTTTLPQEKVNYISFL